MKGRFLLTSLLPCTHPDGDTYGFFFQLDEPYTFCSKNIILDEPYTSFSEDIEIDEPNQSTKTTSNVSLPFLKFNNLRAAQISLVMMEGKAKITIEGNTFDVLPVDLGLKADNQSWKLLESAAVSNGDFTFALKKLNRTNNREKETAKIKTAITRLRQAIKNAMGLEDSPIIYSNGTYRVTFKVMTHEMLKDSNVSKGADVMDYADSLNLDDNINPE